MSKFNIVAIILQIVFGIACVGLGVYYCFQGTAGQAALFIIVGIGCFVNAVRIYLSGKNKDKDE